MSLGEKESESESESLFGTYGTEWEKIVRARCGEYQMLHKCGALRWQKIERVQEKAPELVVAYVAEEPARKKRRKEARSAEKGREAASSEALARSDRATVLRCFLWELSQVFKQHFTTQRYKYMSKYVFKVDYASRVELSTLERAARRRFAPPSQAFKLTIEAALAQVSSADVRDEVLRFAGLPVEWPEKFELGPLVRIAPKSKKGQHSLQIRLPRQVTSDNRPAQGLPGHYDAWWELNLDDYVCPEKKKQEETNKEGTRPKRRLLDRAIARCEAAMRFDPSVLAAARTILKLPEPIDVEQPHSLELVVRCERGIVATMTVPHDATVCQLESWLGSHVCRNVAMEDASGWCTVELPGLFEYQGFDFGHLSLRLSRAEYATFMAETDSVEACIAKRKGGLSRSLAGDWYRATRVFGGRRPMLEYLREKASPENLEPIQFNEDPPPYQVCRTPGPVVYRPKHYLELCVDCAVADIVPVPEEIDPPMDAVLHAFKSIHPKFDDILAYKLEPLCRTVLTFEWSKTYGFVSVAAARRAPRLPDDQYPLIKFLIASPTPLQLPRPTSS